MKMQVLWVVACLLALAPIAVRPQPTEPHPVFFYAEPQFVMFIYVIRRVCGCAKSGVADSVFVVSLQT